MPALLRWGRFALRIVAPQTVLFQDLSTAMDAPPRSEQTSKPALAYSS